MSPISFREKINALTFTIITVQYALPSCDLPNHRPIQSYREELFSQNLVGISLWHRRPALNAPENNFYE